MLKTKGLIMASVKKTSTGFNVVNSRTGDVLKSFSGEGAESRATTLRNEMHEALAARESSKDAMSVVNYGLATQHDKS